MTGCGKRAVTCLAVESKRGRTYGGVDVGGRVDIGSVLAQQRDDRDELFRVETKGGAVNVVQIRARTACLREGEERERTHDRLDRVDGQPPLSGVLVPVLVRARLVQDRDAQFSVLVHCARRRGWGRERSAISTKFRPPPANPTARGHSPFGCHISVRNFILGGRRGKSGGKVMTARRNAPSYSESGGLSRRRRV